MKDNVRQELKELCYFIIENNNALSRPEQLTRVQMLYERLLVLNYLEEVEAEKKASPKPANPAPAKSQAPPKAPAKPEPKPEPVPEVNTPIEDEVHQEPEIVEEPIASADEPSVAAPSTPEPEPSSEDPTPEKQEAETKIESESPKTPEPAAERRDLNDGHQAPKSINDQLGKGAIQVGLNDRIAFVKHLFNDSQADFNRVLSQLNTLDTYLESMYFIENLVKPDYDWEDKKPYEERLINLVKKRFGEDW